MSTTTNEYAATLEQENRQLRKALARNAEIAVRLDIERTDASGEERPPYVASDGSRWYLRYELPPIPIRKFDWSATHEDCDESGPFVQGETLEDVLFAVEEYLFENPEERMEVAS